MILANCVSEFVNNNGVNDALWSHDESPVDVKAVLVIAGSPAPLRTGKPNACGASIHLAFINGDGSLVIIARQ